MGNFQFTELHYARLNSGSFPVRVYLYRTDGFHTGPVHVPTLAALKTMLEKGVRLHVESGREVRITDNGDNLLFHAQDGKILYPEGGLNL